MTPSSITVTVIKEYKIPYCTVTRTSRFKYGTVNLILFSLFLTSLENQFLGSQNGRLSVNFLELHNNQNAIKSFEQFPSTYIICLFLKNSLSFEISNRFSRIENDSTCLSVSQMVTNV